MKCKFTSFGDLLRGGTLIPIEAEQDVPFKIKRIFYILGGAGGITKRGDHSHKNCQQVIIAINGEFDAKVGGETHLLDSPTFGIFVPRGVVVSISNFSVGAIALVLCSEHYSREDIIDNPE
jgi:glyoxylate utilization-related uncharacterized protein